MCVQYECVVCVVISTPVTLHGATYCRKGITARAAGCDVNTCTIQIPYKSHQSLAIDDKDCHFYCGFGSCIYLFVLYVSTALAIVFNDQYSTLLITHFR